ncbi:MAG: hypothetical protein AB2556_19595 [Candidatus Thiodiazotropha sp.]
MRLPADQWVEIFNDAKEDFEVDGAAVVFSSWRVEEKDPLDIGDIQVADGIHAGAGQLALDAHMTDKRAARLLDSLPEGEFLLQLKFLCEQQEGEWGVKDKLTLSVWKERRDRPSLRSLGTQSLAC